MTPIPRLTGAAPAEPTTPPDPNLLAAADMPPRRPDGPSLADIERKLTEVRSAQEAIAVQRGQAAFDAVAAGDDGNAAKALADLDAAFQAVSARRYTNGRPLSGRKARA